MSVRAPDPAKNDRFRSNAIRIPLEPGFSRRQGDWHLMWGCAGQDNCPFFETGGDLLKM